MWAPLFFFLFLFLYIYIYIYLNSIVSLQIGPIWADCKLVGVGEMISMILSFSFLSSHFLDLSLSSLLSKCNVTLFLSFFFTFSFHFFSLSLSLSLFLVRTLSLSLIILIIFLLFSLFFLSHNLSPSHHYLPRPLSLSLSQ